MLIVRVGHSYAPALYLVPVAREPELRIWFRRLPGRIITGLLLLLIGFSLGALSGSILLLGVTGFLFVLGIRSWGSFAQLMFSRRFPDAVAIDWGSSLRKFGNLLIEQRQDGTILVTDAAVPGSEFRVPADQERRLQSWYLRSHLVAWVILIPWITFIIVVIELDRLTSGQKLIITFAILVIGCIFVSKFSTSEFRGKFPDAEQLDAPRSVVAASADVPMLQPILLVPALFGSLIITAIVSTNVWFEPQPGTGELIGAGLMLSLSTFLLAITALKIRQWKAARTSARD
jgi:hypothetical protein